MRVQWSVVLNGLKYIQRRHSGREEIYDLEADPGELRPLAEKELEFVKKSREILKQHHEFSRSLLGRAGIRERGLSEEFQNRLRSVGYLQ